MADINLLKEQTKEFLLDRYGIVGSTQSDIVSLDFISVIKRMILSARFMSRLCA